MKVKTEKINKTETRTFELAFKQPNQPLDRQLDILQNLGREIAQRQSEIQLTPNNLPTAYIDPQAILEKITTATIDTETKSKALIQIDYLDGMPIVNGLPFWERLDCEPLNYYRLFRTYRDEKLTDDTRSFKKLEKDTNTQINYLYALSKIYHWQYRTLAFDIYQLQKIEKERNRQIEIMEGNHKKAAERIFEICITYLESIESSGVIATASPREIQGWADLAIKLERLSLGLPGDKPKTTDNDSEKQKAQSVINVTNIKTQQNQQNQLNMTKSMSDKDLQKIVNILDCADALPNTGNIIEEEEEVVIVNDN